MDRSALPRPARRLGLLLLLALTMAPASGCVGLIATVLYKGRMAPAAFPDLEGSRVAVVCLADSGDFGPNPNAGLLAKFVGNTLAMHVPDIDVVDAQRMAAWHDEHNTEYVEYLEMGKGVKADYVVGIELEEFRLQDSATLFKGRAEYGLKVIDVNNNGKTVYAPFTGPVTYPKISGLHTAGVSEREFRQKFLQVLAVEISQHFYSHDLNAKIAADTPDL